MKKHLLIPAQAVIRFRDLPVPEVTYLEGDEAEEAWNRAMRQYSKNDDEFELTQPAELT